MTIPRPDAPRIPTLQLAAVGLAVVLVAIGVVLRVLDDRVVAGPLPERLTSMLVASAGLCVAGLMLRRAPVVAWLGTVLAAGIAALEIIAVARGWQPLAGAAAWPALAATASSAGLAGAAIAGAYAVAQRPGSPRLRRAAAATVFLGIAATAVGVAWSVSAAVTDANDRAVTADLWPIRATSRLVVVLIPLYGLIGGLRDAVGPWARARARFGAPSRSIASAKDVREMLRLFGDELLPGRASSRRSGIEEERARLAADLHARVLPDLRRAAAAAAGSPGVPEPLTSGLREAIDDVEALMHARQSVVLEQFGLVAALEWLAERTEEQSSIRVAIEIEDGPAIRLARPVERAAFRIALLALDNAVRHASATAATMRLSLGDARLRLEVIDDGRGFDPSAPAVGRTGGRGLADMHSEAIAVGASLVVSSVRSADVPDHGTDVVMTWPGH